MPYGFNEDKSKFDIGTPLEAINNQIITINNDLTAADDTRFRFATDGEGNYGYLGADDRFIPFSLIGLFHVSAKLRSGAYSRPTNAKITRLIGEDDVAEIYKGANKYGDAIKLHKNLDVVVRGMFYTLDNIAYQGGEAKIVVNGTEETLERQIVYKDQPTIGTGSQGVYGVSYERRLSKDDLITLKAEGTYETYIDGEIAVYVKR